MEFYGNYPVKKRKQETSHAELQVLGLRQKMFNAF